MGFGRSSFPHRALPSPSVYGHRTSGPGEARGAHPAIAGGFPWLGRNIWGQINRKLACAHLLTPWTLASEAERAF
jgi:hypothetical protein